MNSPIKWIKTFGIGLIYLIAIQSIHLIVVYSQDKSEQDDLVVLAEGTALDLVTTQEISSKTAHLGDLITFKVDEDVVVNGHVVISKDTPAKGRVMNAEKSGRAGKSGKLGIRFESTNTIDGQPLRIRAAKGKEGNDKTNSVAALSILVNPLFMLKKGGEATIKEGTKIKVYVDEEKRFRASGSSLVAQSATDETAKLDAMEGSTLENKEQMATVYIYRPSKLVGKALEPSVFCDGVELARMDNGRFLTLKLKPGRHTVHMTDQNKGFDLDMRRGEEYYFRVGIETGLWKGQGKIMLEENEKGAAEVKKLKPLDHSKIKDTTMVVDRSIP